MACVKKFDALFRTNSLKLCKEFSPVSKVVKVTGDNITWCQRRWFHKSLTCLDNHIRRNAINIQMLSETFHEQIFKHNTKEEISPASNERAVKNGDHEREILDEIKTHLEKHGLWDRDVPPIPDVDFKLPELFGNNIDDHFRKLAMDQISDYVNKADLLVSSVVPERPTRWSYQAGWTQYDSDGNATKVDFPEEDALVFDMEVLVPEGSYPTMATAVSPKHWYSWCSEHLIQDKFKWTSHPQLEDLIPLETCKNVNTPPGGEWQKRLVIGHNVGFDRSFVKEQYYIQKSLLRFLDTMSLHIAVCGLTNFQRILYQSTVKKQSNRKEVREYLDKHKDSFDSMWKHVSTLNNLNDVYQLHCGGKPLNKATRDWFVKGTMADIRDNFQVLMAYCSSDTLATLEVFKQLWPEFKERFPHPVTLAGMMEMGTAYLPINENWLRYIKQSNVVYDDLQRELKMSLMKLANDACELLHNEEYKTDPWLFDLDWKVADYKLKKAPKVSSKKKVDSEPETDEEETAGDRVNKVLATASRIPKNARRMAGYPQWYRDLCPKPNAEDWSPGPSLISTQTRVTPKLMRLTWEGYPLLYHDVHGWGYILPDPEKAVRDLENPESQRTEDIVEGPQYPVQLVFELCGQRCPEELGKILSEDEYEAMLTKAQSRFDTSDMLWEEKSRHLSDAGISPRKFKTEDRIDINIPGCWFIKLPHKDGQGKNVGNPLAKDFLSKVEEEILQAQSGGSADRALKLGKMCSYWKNNQKRIESQMVVGLKKSELNKSVTRSEDYEEDKFYGAIVPRIAPAGTITRRAVEQTWLTASNAYVDRIGSELKAMIQAPPGYHFVGADVDSQELWIAAIIGDSHAKTHGCTAFGWMTLQGTKADKTDLHSKTAETVGITRDHAKVFNYGRIYGAGQRFAETLLIQFNHKLTPEEAKKKARVMYSTTKGKRKTSTGKWDGGSESEMFNKLEEIATSLEPVTPVLGCHISKALEPDYVGSDFMTSRINWVVQSSAVDYLHLMLVCMRWLFDTYNIDGRFAISIHDEVRYLVRSPDRYRASLALQITNLLTRSMFAYKLGMDDLPQSVAFFSAVDIDRCLRKEVNMDCKTPSNPHGMERGYGIPQGEALDIYKIVEENNGTLEPGKQKRSRTNKKNDNNARKINSEVSSDQNAEDNEVLLVKS